MPTFTTRDAMTPHPRALLACAAAALASTVEATRGRPPLVRSDGAARIVALAKATS